MIINLSEQASNTVLDSLASLMDGGAIEVLSSSGYALAVLKLSSPAAQAASGGEIELAKISEGTTTAAGRAETARIVGADGREILSCDVGGPDSDAVIQLNTAQLSAGGPVRINSFRLAMP